MISNIGFNFFGGGINLVDQMAVLKYEDPAFGFLGCVEHALSLPQLKDIIPLNIKICRIKKTTKKIPSLKDNSPQKKIAQKS